MSTRKGGAGGGVASKDPSQKTLQETFSGLSQKKPPSGSVAKKEVSQVPNHKYIIPSRTPSPTPRPPNLVTPQIPDIEPCMHRGVARRDISQAPNPKPHGPPILLGSVIKMDGHPNSP